MGTKRYLKQGKCGIIFLLGLFFLTGLAHQVFASRFSLFALDIQVPLQKGQSVGEARKKAISKGIRQAVEEATYKIIPQQGVGMTYQKLKASIIDKAERFVPQYKILGEKQFPGMFNLSLQVTVDVVLLRKALLGLGVLGVQDKKAASRGPVTLEIRNLTDGKALTGIIGFFKQRPDLAEGFELVRARHGVFTFKFLPLQPLKGITSQILYHAQVSQGTFNVIKQEKDRLILLYQLGKQS